MLGRSLLTQGVLRRKNAQVLISQFQRLCHYEVTPEHGKIYELRCYQVNMKDIKKFVEITGPGMKIRTQYSRMMGYWQSEYGGVCNQFLHLWEWDSLDHRVKTRKKLTADPTWAAEYLNHALPMWNFQESNLLRLLPWAKIPAQVQDGGIYQLERLSINGDGGKGMEKIAKYGLSQDEENERQLLGAWNVICGKVNTVCLLHRYATQDGAINHYTQDKSKTAQAYKSMLPLTTSVESRILLPLTFSPWK